VTRLLQRDLLHNDSPSGRACTNALPCLAGTGKTTAVVEIILQEVARGNKVPCCKMCPFITCCILLLAPVQPADHVQC